MKSKFFKNEFEEIKKILKLNNKLLDNIDDALIPLYLKSVQKTTILSLYTTWESIIKEVLFQGYKKYKTLVLTEEMLKDSVAKSLSKRYLKDNFFENLLEKKIEITKENLCSSNNLKRSELIELLKINGYKYQEIIEYFNDLEFLRSYLDNCQEKGLFPIYNEKRPSDIFEKIIGYIDLLVEERNKISHVYEIDTRLSIEQLEVIIEIVEETIKIILDFISVELLKKSFDSDELKIYESLNLLKIYTENRPLSDKNFVFALENISSKKLKQSDILYFFNEEDRKCFPVQMREIKNEAKELIEEIEVGAKVSIKGEAYKKINKGKNYFLFLLKDRISLTDYKIHVI